MFFTRRSSALTLTLITLMLFIVSCNKSPMSSTTPLGSKSRSVVMIPPPGTMDIQHPYDTTLPTSVALCTDSYVHTGYPLRQLFAYPDQWASTRAAIDEFGYYDQILDGNFTDAALEDIFLQLNGWAMPLMLETGVLWYVTTGEQSFNDHQPLWDRFFGCGANISTLAMNEPFYISTEYFATLTPEEAVEETAYWMYLVRQNYPSIEILSVEPYPAKSADSLIWWIESLNLRCEQLGIAGIDGFSIDPNWAWSGQFHWNDILDIEAYCDQEGIPFSLIYWAADASPGGPGTPDVDWYRGVMYEGAQSSSAGVTPDIYVVQSWLYIPREIIPETNGGYTFTKSVLDFYSTYVP